jgi:hypothetical protein
LSTDWAGSSFDTDGAHPYYYKFGLQQTKYVTRELKGISITPHPALYRVVAFLLLSFIVYGTTVEAAHKHGNVQDSSQSTQAAAISEPGTTTTSGGTLAGCGECLICQLHQNFSSSLTVEREGSSPSRTRLEISLATSTAPTSRTDAPHTGRAPPFTS